MSPGSSNPLRDPHAPSKTETIDLKWSLALAETAFEIARQRTRRERGPRLLSHKTTASGGATQVGSAGLAVCRLGKRVRFHTAAQLVNQLEAAQKQYQLERLLTKLEKLNLLVNDELGYLSFSRAGAELLFQVIAERYERSSTLVTTNLPFGEWAQIFQGERMTAALLDRLTHRCHILEMNATSYRFKESTKRQQKAN